MSVSSEITRLYGVRSDIFDAITAKGVTVPQGSVLDDAPDLIGQISSGPAPISLPAKTLRLLYPDGYTPNIRHATLTQVSASPNVWDMTYDDSDWEFLLNGQTLLLEVIAAGDMSGVTSMYNLFCNCAVLRSVCLFDTSNCTNMGSMFYGCPLLTKVPLFDTGSTASMSQMFSGCSGLTEVQLFSTSSCTDMSFMFMNCTKVTQGALALYQQASTQSTPPSNYMMAFTNCGKNTSTGSAELAQIPSDWK